VGVWGGWTPAAGGWGSGSHRACARRTCAECAAVAPSSKAPIHLPMPWSGRSTSSIPPPFNPNDMCPPMPQVERAQRDGVAALLRARVRRAVVPGSVAVAVRRLLAAVRRFASWLAPRRLGEAHGQMQARGGHAHGHSYVLALGGALGGRTQPYARGLGVSVAGMEFWSRRLGRLS
jgi:hypothetical protein